MNEHILTFLIYIYTLFYLNIYFDFVSWFSLEIIHGGILFQSKHIITPVTEDLAAAFDNDPMTKLKKFATKKMLRLVDLFRQFDKDNSWSVSHEEFTMGVKVSLWYTWSASLYEFLDWSILIFSHYHYNSSSFVF